MREFLGGIDAVQILMTQYTVNQAVRASAHQAALEAPLWAGSWADYSGAQGLSVGGLDVTFDGSDASVTVAGTVDFMDLDAYSAPSLSHAMARAVAAAATLLFRISAVATIRAVTDARNAHSIAVLARAGFQRISEQSAFFKGEECREITFALARSES